MPTHSGSTWRKAARLAVTTVALSTLASTAPAAFANEADPVADEIVIGTQPPAEPEETGLSEVAPGDAAQEPGTDPNDDLQLPRPPKPGGDTPDREICDRANVYIPQTKGGQYHKGVGATLSNTNRTSRTITSQFTSEVSGTVGVSVTAGLTVSVNTMLTKIEGKYDVNLHASLTAKLGNNVTASTPPGKTTNAKYGVYRLKNTGTSYKIYDNCQTSAKKTITSYSPLKVGWYVWES
ncbi:hypothetical protein [Streptomyces sp. NPDC018693]|uniref:hypothetical protein n=1 Tax=unclassified Streptomyces TaxID=2593676 RepID=UPI0037917C76